MAPLLARIGRRTDILFLTFLVNVRVADHTLRAIAKRYAVREEESTHLVWQLVGIGGKIIGDSRTLP